MLNFIYIHSSDKLCDFTVQLRCNVRICLVSKTITKLPHCLSAMVVAIRHTLFLVFSDLYRNSGPENRKHFSNNIGPNFFNSQAGVTLCHPLSFLVCILNKKRKKKQRYHYSLTTYQKQENKNVSCALCWSIYFLNDVLF